MRVLTSDEIAVVGGGFYDGFYPVDTGGGGGGGGGGVDYAGGAWTAITWASRAISLYDLVDFALDHSGIGVAGRNASEMDNGGTSYGIGVCNTFGCP